MSGQWIVRQLQEPTLAAGRREDCGAGGKDAPMLEDRFDLELEAGLAADGVVIGLGGTFEEDAEFAGGLPDRFVFVEPEEAGQGKGIPPVMFIGMGADETIVAGIADDQLVDMRTEQLNDPAGTHHVHQRHCRR